MTNLSRREFLRFGGAALVGAALIGSTASSMTLTTDHFQLTEYAVPVHKLPREFDGYRIGVVADIHYGRFMAEEWIVKVVDLLNESEADMVVVAGDHICLPGNRRDNFFGLSRNPAFNCPNSIALIEKIYGGLSTLLKPLHPPDGVYAVYGNHDRWTAPYICRRLMSRATTLLVNDNITIRRGPARLLLSGVDDYWTGLPRVPALAPIEEEREIRVVVSHNPDYLSQLLRLRNFDFHLGIAGHTHGGQIRLPLVGAPTYRIRDGRFNEGLVGVGNTSVYTSRGVGVVGIPYRVNCPPDVAVLKLGRVA